MGKSKLSWLIDWGIIGLGLSGLVAVFGAYEGARGFILTAGAIGTVLWAVYLMVWIFSPIRRDWEMVYGHVMRKILGAVLLAPFVLTFLCLTFMPATESWDLFSNGATFIDESESLKEMQESADQQPKEKTSYLFMSFYYHFMDPGGQLQATAEGRTWAAFAVLLGVLLLNGLLVSVLVGWFDRRRDYWLKGDIRYKFFFSWKRHYVIVGGNKMVEGIVRQLFEKDPKAYILVMTSADIEDFRRKLYSCLTREQCQQVILYYGNRSSKEDIRALQLDKTIELFIIGEDVEQDDKESFHDSLNMECLELVAGECPERKEGNKLDCHVMFEYQTTFSIFQFYEISNAIQERLNFMPFNSYEMWAQKVLICKTLKDYDRMPFLPLEGVEGIGKEDEHFVHLVIVGMSRMGVAMAVEAAHLAHYPNFNTKKIRTRITFIDNNMEQEIDFFMGRFPALFKLSHYRYAVGCCDHVQQEEYSLYDDPENRFKWVTPVNDDKVKEDTSFLGDDFMDVEWEFLQGSVEEPMIRRYLVDASNNDMARMTVAVCLPETNQSVAAAIYLPKQVFDNAMQILVYQRTSDALTRNLNKDARLTPYKGKLRSFGMQNQTFDLSIWEDACKIANWVGEQYGVVTGNDKCKHYQCRALRMLVKAGRKEVLQQAKKEQQLLMERCRNEAAFMALVEKKRTWLSGYLSEFDTKEKRKKLKKTAVARNWSNVYNANMLWTKLRCLEGLHLEEEGPAVFTDDQLLTLSEVEHNRWNMEQLLMSYRPVKLEEQFLLYEMAEQQCADVDVANNCFKSQMIHSNILSVDRLLVLDKTFYIDLGLSEGMLDYYFRLQQKA